MDIKLERERINMLCHGCLASDRTVRDICGEIKDMFYVLKKEQTHKERRKDLVLCWECVAFLEKLKMFQARIETAQCLLMQYLHSYYRMNSVQTPACLSSLKTFHTNTYSFEFCEEEKREEDLSINIKNKNEKPILSQPVELVTDIKVEKVENDIKEENNYSNDSDSDYYETFIEKKDSVNKTSQEKNSIPDKNRYKKYKKYEMLATITKRTDVKKKNYNNLVEEVIINRSEYEKVLKRDKGRYGYLRLPFKCEDCKEAYLKKMDLQRHLSSYHSDKLTFPYNCAGCSTTMTSQEQQDHHWAEAHSKAYKCTICSEIHQTSIKAKEHIKVLHKKQYTCKECELDCGSLRDFKKHYKKMHERVTCDLCNMDFSKKKSLISHMKRIHIPAFCKICNRMYTNYKTYKYHRQVTHPELAGAAGPRELAYCVECDKQYPSVYKYQKHIQQSVKHTKQKKVRVPCPECGKIFSRTNFMRNHYKFAHLKVTKHYCDQCNKYYSTGYGLRQHIVRFHNKIAQPKDKICDLCGRGFGTNKILQNHRRTHTGERPFKCKYCPAAFAQQTAMKTHEKSQHKNLALSR